MHYVLFNNEIMISDGENVRRIDKEADLNNSFGSIDVARVCVVDVDVLIAAAVEFPTDKKDAILVRKFKEFYQHEEYIIQDERIDNNLFQVIGVKAQKVREVYSLISPDKVEVFIPYGMALRNTLINKNIDLNKTIVFVDDWASERLVTVFDGLKFSRTRVIANTGEEILPEIKRSQIDFLKKTEEYLSKKSADFIIVVNSRSIAAEISKNKEEIQVEYLDVAYPALEGLKGIDTSIKYREPDEIFKKRREAELKKKLTTAVFSGCVVAAGLFYFLFNKVEWGGVNNQVELQKQTQARLEDQLKTLDQETYRQDLMLRKSLNYGVSYLSTLNIIPASYTVNAFKFYKTGTWNIEMILFPDNGGIFDPIPRVKILKNAEIKDIFVNNQPGKHLKVSL